LKPQSEKKSNKGLATFDKHNYFPVCFVDMPKAQNIEEEAEWDKQSGKFSNTNEKMMIKKIIKSNNQIV
jgi:hypothetical protein